ncbi:hypothetical protein F6Q07_22110 [Pectobacterium parmentieri]|uniref:hypothetical protein n=1 Tax=Pectobacterium parmentieri TaxID=1905730 RepID=UPI0018DFF390|nr:hypothetical protein [Pectobacterium parmentieri]MBI0520774.1 hypothetical protein [Pectobacterium parmentieri]
MAEENLIKKANHYVDEYADSFGYASFGNGEYRAGSISFFKSVTEWPNTEQEDNIPTVVNKYNMATIRMSEDLMLKLARFIIEQHDKSKNNATSN